MEDFEFEPKTHIEDYLKETINVEILERISKWRAVATGESYNKELEDDALGFLNSIYHGYHTFLYNMNNPGVISDIFSVFKSSCRYIDTLVHFYKIELTPLSESSLDIIANICELNEVELFSYNYTKYKIDGIAIDFTEISLLPNTKQKLIKLIAFRSKVVAMYFKPPYKATQNTIIEKVTFKINDMEQFHSMGLLADENYSDNDEIDTLAKELKKVVLELKNYRFLYTETKAKLQKEKDLHLRTKIGIDETKERLNKPNDKMISLANQLDDLKSILHTETDLHHKTQNELSQLKEELKNANEEISHLHNLLSVTSYKLKTEQTLHLQTKTALQTTDDGMVEFTVKDRFGSKGRYPAHIFQGYNQKSKIDIIETNEIPLVKKSISDKRFPDYILHKDRDQLADMIKNEFSTEKAKPLRIVLKAMELYNPPLITIGKRQGKEIYNSLCVFLDREIGTYQGVIGSTIASKADQSDVDSATLRLNHLIKMIDNV